MSWQPIETYRPEVDPPDVLVSEGQAVGEARYHNERGWWWVNNDPTDSWGGQIWPDHWMPLPAPPPRPAQTVCPQHQEKP